MSVASIDFVSMFVGCVNSAKRCVERNKIIRGQSRSAHTVIISTQTDAQEKIIKVKTSQSEHCAWNS